MTTDHTPPAEQDALRDRIAEALYARDHPSHVVPLNETGMGPAYRESADAVLAVLPPPVSRADVLREALAAAEAVNGRFPYGASGERIIAELQRLTDEAQPGTEAAS